MKNYPFWFVGYMKNLPFYLYYLYQKPSFFHSKPCIYAVYPTSKTVLFSFEGMSKTVRFRKLRVCKTVLFSFEGVKIRVFQFITFTWLRNHFFPVSYPLWHGFIPTFTWFRNHFSPVSYSLLHGLYPLWHGFQIQTFAFFGKMFVVVCRICCFERISAISKAFGGFDGSLCLLYINVPKID